MCVWPKNVKEFSPEHLEYFFNSEDGVLDSNGVKKMDAKVPKIKLHCAALMHCIDVLLWLA